MISITGGNLNWWTDTSQISTSATSGKRRNTKMFWTTKEHEIYFFFDAKCIMNEILRVCLNCFRSYCLILLHPLYWFRSMKVQPKLCLCYSHAVLKVQLGTNSDLLLWSRLRTADYLCKQNFSSLFTASWFSFLLKPCVLFIYWVRWTLFC